MTPIRKKYFSTLLKHLEPSGLVFWEVNKSFAMNTCDNWGFGFFPTIWSTLTFWAIFGHNAFSALPNFKCLFLKNVDRCEKSVRPLFEKHPSVYISELSFTRTPKTVIGGINSEENSEKVAFRYLIEQMLILAIPVTRSSSNLAGRSISASALNFAPNHSDQVPEKLSQIDFWIFLKNTYHPSTNYSKFCSVDRIDMNFLP